jgi:hypothetical protein
MVEEDLPRSKAGEQASSMRDQLGSQEVGQSSAVKSTGMKWADALLQGFRDSVVQTPAYRPPVETPRPLPETPVGRGPRWLGDGLMTRFIKPGLGPRVQQPGLRVRRPFETGPSLPPPSRLVPLEPRPMAIRSYGKGPSPGTEPVRTYTSSPEERSNSLEIGLLRNKIQKADEGRSNTEDEILLLE